jgi:peptidoglycan/LPS O-acetylase OafA/YrhL
MPSLKLELAAPVSGRLPVLDELKGLAIVLVVLYHAGGVLVWNNYLHGDLGVDIFVILSGVGLALGSRYEGPRDFLLRRFTRIFPTYWIVLTLYWILNTHFLQHDYSAFNLVIHYLGIHGWFGDAYAMAINDSFWFITLIVTLYVLYCLLHPLLVTPEKLLLAGAAICLVIALIFFFTGQSGVFGHMGLRMPGFFVGLLLGRLLKTGRLELTLATPLALAIFLLTYVPYTQGVIFASVAVGLALMGTYAFAWKQIAPLSIRTPVERTLKFLGDHSLEIFLIHQPLIRQYNYYLHGRWFHIPEPGSVTLIVGIVLGLILTLFLSVELRSLTARFSGNKTLST